MKHLALLLFLFGLATSAAADEGVGEAETFLAALRVSEALYESAAVETGFWEGLSLVNCAYADPGKCMLAGFVGRVDPKTLSCKPAEDSKYREEEAKCRANDPALRPCNPEVFGFAMCINPKKSARWTNACAAKFLGALGIQKDLSSRFTPDELNLVANQLKDLDVDVAQLAKNADAVCKSFDPRRKAVDNRDCQTLAAVLSGDAQKTALLNRGRSSAGQVEASCPKPKISAPVPPATLEGIRKVTESSVHREARQDLSNLMTQTFREINSPTTLQAFKEGAFRTGKIGKCDVGFRYDKEACELSGLSCIDLKVHRSGAAPAAEAAANQALNRKFYEVIFKGGMMEKYPNRSTFLLDVFDPMSTQNQELLQLLTPRLLKRCGY